MKIGYPCMNHTINCTTNSTFRLASYSSKKLIDTVTRNLRSLQEILTFNVKHDLLFFRIGSGIVPFASHPICNFDWQTYFREDLIDIGCYIKQNKIRISMHPDQFILINALDENILARSIAELDYHCNLLDIMELDDTAKVQIHVGGSYGNKIEAIKRFIERYHALPMNIKKRLVIENDDRLFDIRDCMLISKKTKVPIILDIFHHECLNNNESVREVLQKCSETWKKKDGIPMIDYSSQQKEARKGKHCLHINTKKFVKFLDDTKGINFDIMLEIKDKEKSALKAQRIITEKLE